MSSKKKRQQAHFVQRCEERVGEKLRMKTIRQLIQDKKLEFIENQSLRVSIWEYPYSDVIYHVVYDRYRRQVVTIYKPNHTQFVRAQELIRIRKEEALEKEDGRCSRKKLITFMPEDMPCNHNRCSFNNLPSLDLCLSCFARECSGECVACTRACVARLNSQR